jgi:hypothetical protein
VAVVVRSYRCPFVIHSGGFCVSIARCEFVPVSPPANLWKHRTEPAVSGAARHKQMAIPWWHREAAVLTYLSVLWLVRILVHKIR